MNQPTDKKIYDGFVDCFVKTIKSDGVLSLWRGVSGCIFVLFLWTLFCAV